MRERPREGSIPAREKNFMVKSYKRAMKARGGKTITFAAARKVPIRMAKGAGKVAAMGARAARDLIKKRLLLFLRHQ